MRRVAILGAGPAGLTSAKAALEYGLEPFVLEREKDLGGLWHPDSGSTWESMITTRSRFTCMFSDAPWPKNSPLFPTSKEIYAYLQAYADFFKLKQYIHYNSTVSKVSMAAGKWKICWTNTTGTHEVIFDHIIIATGFFSKPSVPKFALTTQFNGTILHSKYYKNPDPFKGKRVAVIGGAFSAIEIATDLASVASQVVNVFNSPPWIIPRFVPENPAKKGAPLPIDFKFYNRASRFSADEAILKNKEENLKANIYIASICKQQASIHRDLILDTFSDQPPMAAMSDSYLDLVQKEKIIPRKAKDIHFTEKGLRLNHDDESKFDAIILGTGYEANFSFLDEPILKILEFQKNDSFQPIILYKSTIHPQLPNAAIVGAYRGPYFAVMELQARWACMLFSNNLSLPSEKIMLKGLEEERRIRDQQPRPQYPHGDYLGFADSIAREIKVLPNFSRKWNIPELHQKIWNGPALPSHYRLIGSHAKPRVALKTIMAADEVIRDLAKTTDILKKKTTPRKLETKQISISDKRIKSLTVRKFSFFSKKKNAFTLCANTAAALVTMSLKKS